MECTLCIGIQQAESRRVAEVPSRRGAAKIDLGDLETRPLGDSFPDVVFEDDATYVVLHDDWSVRGHAMIVHRRHVENVSDLTSDEWTHFSGVWRAAERVLLDLTGCERAVILKLGIATPHLHVHIYPVLATATREEVFAAIDGKTRVEREEGFVERVREGLRR